MEMSIAEASMDVFLGFAHKKCIATLSFEKQVTDYYILIFCLLGWRMAGFKGDLFQDSFWCSAMSLLAGRSVGSPGSSQRFFACFF
jgi:hypothetical protein